VTYASAGAMLCNSPCMFQAQPTPWQTVINVAYPSSPHNGGINALLGDASVRVVTNGINPNTWWKR